MIPWIPTQCERVGKPHGLHGIGLRRGVCCVETLNSQLGLHMCCVCMLSALSEWPEGEILKVGAPFVRKDRHTSSPCKPCNRIYDEHKQTWWIQLDMSTRVNIFNQTSWRVSFSNRGEKKKKTAVVNQNSTLSYSSCPVPEAGWQSHN